ncbi:EpsG family protein [Flavobacterium sp.]|uniref:EpsG family protein n=1 Tax=Flavobacterium sp. TaxID=239 RepID=UPI0022C47304|nr:EpsG family protein [Flavobacterium sp.]MCZ8144124.1 EpsG family protein [Flavobacterium sp.]MCZ8366255.1 EpsG family protein [Flavobacterium sp.]
MNTLVPLPIYTDLFYHFTLVICILVIFNCFTRDLALTSNRKFISGMAFLVFALVLLHMGLRPVNYRFGDMMVYNAEFVNLMRGNPPKGEVEFLFQNLMEILAKFKSPELFFFTCTALYITPLYYASKRIFLDYWGYAFLMLVFSFSFWSYGVNGIRNGIAGSIFILALSQKTIVKKALWFLIALLFHKSMLLPLMGYLAFTLVKNVKLYFLFWLFCIPLSLVLGSVLESFFLSVGFVDDQKLSIYLGDVNELNEGVELKVGFRWDFLLFSALPVISGAYFIFKQKIQDVIFQQLTALYLFANGFWILIIRANYSNRFAYLSWFLMGIILIFPLIKYKFFKNQNSVVACVILFYFLFGYLLNII